MVTLHALHHVLHQMGLTDSEDALALEAAAVAQAGGPVDIIDDKVTGLLLPPRDVDALVAAVAWERRSR